MRCWLILLLVAGAVQVRAASYFVTVAGLGGSPDYEAQFSKWAGELERELQRNGPAAHVVTLSGAAATREAVKQQLVNLAATVEPDDEFSLFLIGHGTFDGTDYKMNLPGPDMTAGELAGLLNRIPARRQLVVNMTSCSGASIPVFARAGRIVITATKSGTEKNAPVFPRYWIDALRDPAADADKNGTLTTLEIFRYADRKTAAYFDSEKLLATEHALLTDDGKPDAIRDPNPKNGQGLLAARFALVQPEGEVAKAAAPGKQRLIARKEDLEGKIDRLKYQKAAMTADDYKNQLTALLLELARTQAEIDQ